MERVEDGGLRTIFGGEDNHNGGSRRWKIRMTDGGEGNGREGCWEEKEGGCGELENGLYTVEVDDGWRLGGRRLVEDGRWRR